MKTMRRFSILTLFALLVVFPATATLTKKMTQNPRMTCMKSCRTDYANCMKNATDQAARTACAKEKTECDKACADN